MKKKKDKQIRFIIPAHIDQLLQKFQGHYLAEKGERISKAEVINNALEWYIKECYRISKME